MTILNSEQKCKYPFYKNSIIDKNELLEYFTDNDVIDIDIVTNVLDGERIKISLSEDIGVIIDKYTADDRLVSSETLYFEDWFNCPSLVVKVWETEEMRDIGESVEVESYYALANAKSTAESLWLNNNFACIEVQDELNCYETLAYFFKGA